MKVRCVEIKSCFNYVNFWTDGMILFLKVIFGTWYKGGLFLLILCKIFVYMYDVELNAIWIWKYIESCFNNWFENIWVIFKNRTFHN